MTEVPSLKITVPFDTPLEPPFFIVKAPDIYIQNIASLTEAVDEFARIGVPAAGLTMAYVADYRGVIACGHITREWANDAEWFGVDEGFRALERHPLLDPLEVASAEIMARNQRRHG